MRPPLALQEIGRIYKSVVRELKLELTLGNKQLEGSHPHNYMRRFMSQLCMTPKEYLWGEALTLALLPLAATGVVSIRRGPAACFWPKSLQQDPWNSLQDCVWRYAACGRSAQRTSIGVWAAWQRQPTATDPQLPLSAHPQLPCVPPGLLAGCCSWSWPTC